MIFRGHGREPLRVFGGYGEGWGFIGNINSGNVAIMGGIQDGTVSELARMRGSDNGPSDNWRMGRYERRLLNLGIRDCMRTEGKRRRGGPRV